MVIIITSFFLRMRYQWKDETKEVFSFMACAEDCPAITSDPNKSINIKLRVVVSINPVTEYNLKSTT